MDEINVYIATSAKSIAKQHIAGLFLIEFITGGKTITTNIEDERTRIYSEASTAQRVTGYLLIKAVRIIPEMMRHYIKDPPENINVYIDKITSPPFMNRWYEKWYEDGYITSSGKEIANAEIWEHLNAAIFKANMHLDYHDDHHSYSDLMHRITQKTLNEQKKP